jgi:hypothetical protein
MDLPDGIEREPLRLPSGRSVVIWKWRPPFPHWQGEALGEPFKKTYTVKPLVDVDGERHFAELAICRSLAKYGWNAVWLDAFHGDKVWDRMLDVGTPTEVPAPVRAEYASVLSAKGVWDVFAWKADRALFAESKGPRDKIRTGQLEWLDAASQSGLPLEFMIVEWSLAAS